MYDELTHITEILQNAQKIVVVQADNPDSDSLASALALEGILNDLGKEAILYCAVDMPTYLHYMQGWDRVLNQLPRTFDASIIVDASTLTLLEKLTKSGEKNWLATKPCIVLDHHHTVENPISFASVTINDPSRASTGELLYLLAKQANWQLKTDTLEYILSSILGDTQGLSNQLASSQTYRIVADIIDAGVDRGALEERRKEYSKMPQSIYAYKAKLIQSTSFYADGQIAVVTVPQDDITQYSPLYNPGPLIQGDMLQIEGVKVAIVLKRYDDGKVTGAIRCNALAGIAAQLAESFDGGGHAYASGFKQTKVSNYEELLQRCIDRATELLTNNTNEASNATV